MRKLLVGLIVGGCGGDPLPACADLRHSPVDVDLTGAAPVFGWDGDRPHGFAVLDEAGLPRWEVRCGCPDDGCVEPEDFEARACIAPPLTYGEVPALAGLDRSPEVQLEALPLLAGRTYTAVIWSDCDAEGPSRLVRSTDFTAP